MANRELSDEELDDVVKAIEALEQNVGAMWADIKEDIEGLDQRWMAIAKTHLQEGFMAFVRAVTKPTDVFEQH